MEQLHLRKFNNLFTKKFPGDTSLSTKPRQTPGNLYSLTNPTPVNKPTLIGWSADLAKQLNIATADEQDTLLLGGNLVNPSMQPYAACYAGHQFGNWAGQLGDGRAITLGEMEVSEQESWELQLKGAGPTAYSRRADGRAVLRSSVREFLMSEAMHHLGIPTTRALSLVSTGDKVVRDMFYNGNPQYEPGAIVARMAPSFLRFGNFEMLAARQEMDQLKALTDWTIEKFFPNIQGDDRILQWLAEVVERTATMIVEWMRVGFVHGVMNTDNMSILGLTIDYGPFSFLDNYDADFTPNTTDLPGKRYAFGKQAAVGYWNLGCLANAIAPLIEEKEKLVAVIESYEEIYWSKYSRMMANKLGFMDILPEDHEILTALETMMTAIQPDMTIFYQLLISLPDTILFTKDEEASKKVILPHFHSCFYQLEMTSNEQDLFYDFIVLYLNRLKLNSCSNEERMDLMKKTNPRFILRNYLLHMAITALEKGDDKLFLQLQQAMVNPYSDQGDQFFNRRPDWANEQAGCSMLSCSS